MLLPAQRRGHERNAAGHPRRLGGGHQREGGGTAEPGRGSAIAIRRFLRRGRGIVDAPARHPVIARDDLHQRGPLRLAARARRGDAQAVAPAKRRVPPAIPR